MENERMGERKRLRPKRKWKNPDEMIYEPVDDLTIEVDQCLEKLTLPARITKQQQDIIFEEMHTLLKRHFSMNMSGNWYCLNDGDKITVIPEDVPEQPKDVKSEPVDNHCEEIHMEPSFSGELEVGRTVTTNDGVVGTLICSSQMGFDPMDVFNDMMVEEVDLKSFLGPQNYHDTDRAALSIKAYLKLCHMTSRSTWKPSSEMPLSNIEIDENIEQIYNTENLGEESFENSFEEFDSDGLEKPPDDKLYMPPAVIPEDLEKPKPKKTGTVRRPKRNSNAAPAPPTHFTIKQIQDAVLSCCDICNPNGEKKFPFETSAERFDAAFAKHMKTVHNMQDQFNIEEDYWNSLKPLMDDKSAYNDLGLDYECTKCEFTVKHSRILGKKPDKQKVRNLLTHLKYHQDLEASGKSFGSYHGKRLYPCPYCELPAPYDSLAAIAQHITTRHPPFKINCRVPGCDYVANTRVMYQYHWKEQHREAGLQKKQEFQCDLCPKILSSRTSFLRHYKVCHNRTVKCEICGAMVSSKRTLNAHMVWDHGEEKKFSCDFCPAKFMSYKNKKKHLLKFHGADSDPSKPIAFRNRGPDKKRAVPLPAIEAGQRVIEPNYDFIE